MSRRGRSAASNQECVCAACVVRGARRDSRRMRGRQWWPVMFVQALSRRKDARSDHFYKKSS